MQGAQHVRLYAKQTRKAPHKTMQQQKNCSAEAMQRMARQQGRWACVGLVCAKMPSSCHWHWVGLPPPSALRVIPMQPPSLYEWASHFVPIVRWLPSYKVRQRAAHFWHPPSRPAQLTLPHTPSHPPAALSSGATTCWATWLLR